MLHSESNDIWLVYFKHKGASANIAWLKDHRDVAFLHDMFSTNRCKGEGSELLREIDEYCQANKITLFIEAVVFDGDHDGIQTNDELKTWYEKNGAVFATYTEEGHPMLLLGDQENWEEEEKP